MISTTSFGAHFRTGAEAPPQQVGSGGDAAEPTLAVRRDDDASARWSCRRRLRGEFGEGEGLGHEEEDRQELHGLVGGRSDPDSRGCCGVVGGEGCGGAAGSKL